MARRKQEEGKKIKVGRKEKEREMEREKERKPSSCRVLTVCREVF